MDIGSTLHVTDREAWRRWLAAHHATEPEIWLVYANKASGKPRIPYNDAVEEALCFGWIDSIVKSLDAQHAAQRFSPRRPRSNLSEMNKVRIARLIERGKMTQAGIESVRHLLDGEFTLPADIEEALRADAETWRNFQAFPESYKRIRAGFIDAARSREDVFRRRLAYLLRMTKQNKRFGMVQ